MEIEYKNQWTEEQIKVAEVTIKKAQAYNWLHIQSYKYYSSLARVTRFITSALILLLSSVGVIISNLNISSDTIKIVQTAIYGLFILFSLLALILEIWNPGTRAAEHYNLAERNKELYQELRADLIELVTHDQIHQMLTDRLKTELHMRDDSPFIPKAVWKKYYKTFDKRALPMDILICNDDIQVVPITRNSIGEITVNNKIVRKTSIKEASDDSISESPKGKIQQANRFYNSSGPARGASSFQPYDGQVISARSPLHTPTQSPPHTPTQSPPQSPPDTPTQSPLHNSTHSRSNLTHSWQHPTMETEQITISDVYPQPNQSTMTLRANNLYDSYAKSLQRSVNTKTEIERAYKYVDKTATKNPQNIDLVEIMKMDRRNSLKDDYEMSRFIADDVK